MKLKISLIVIAVALVTFGMSGAAFAFHNGGVAACESCHTMHNSKDGKVMSRVTNTIVTNNLVIGQAGIMLLQGSDQSSTCLNCHGANKATAGSYTILSLAQTVPTQRTPGGDFAWLKLPSGSKKGHSIVAVDYGLTAETTKAGNVAPGGTYPVAALNCISCHDPHGKFRKLSTGGFSMSGEPIASSGSYGADPTSGEAVGAYRLLGGKTYMPKSLANPALAFDEDAISAAAPSSYNVSEAAAEIVVNYGDSSAGAWCQQCHPKMHMSGSAINVHPNDQALGSTISGIYNSYVKTGDMGGGAAAGYTSLVPVAYDNITTNSQLAGHFTKGAAIASSDRVMCLSCHRAHASGFDYMLRFPIVEVMTGDQGGISSYQTGTDPAKSAVSGLTPAMMQAALYDRPATNFAIEQRTLCNKCHAKD
jgi:cytochrome c553